MSNLYVKKASDLVTTSEARRKGFLEYALRKNKESIPFIDCVKALKARLERTTTNPRDLLVLGDIRGSLLVASGVSVKARNYLQEDDQKKLIEDFIEEVLIPSGTSYIEELIYRYLLAAGDALGGKMRNIIGSIANEKFTRFIISQLQISNLNFSYFKTDSMREFGSKNYHINDAEKIKAIQWSNNFNKNRLLIYNKNVPMVTKNIDIILLNQNIKSVKSAELKSSLGNPNNYLAMGELKGGIDPAGADEHWKTANTALQRVRKAFNTNLPLIFIGAAIETAMSQEIFQQYQTGQLANCANLTSDEQLASLCDWLVNI